VAINPLEATRLRRVPQLESGEGRMKQYLAALVFLALASCMDRHGVIGAVFRLRDDSPLPSWVSLPTGVSRDQVSVTITRYEATTTPKWKVRIVVRVARQGVLQEEIGYGFWHPDSEREKIPAGAYPNWVIIEVKGTKEVYEQSEANDLLRIVKKPLT
jgi:hypothetical protein